MVFECMQELKTSQDQVIVCVCVCVCVFLCVCVCVCDRFTSSEPVCRSLSSCQASDQCGAVCVGLVF